MMASSGFYLDEFSAGTRHANAVLEDESLDPMSASIFGALPATHRPNTGPEASDDHGLRAAFMTAMMAGAWKLPAVSLSLVR